jgi:hypothetical protein
VRKLIVSSLVSLDFLVSGVDEDSTADKAFVEVAGRGGPNI